MEFQDIITMFDSAPEYQGYNNQQIRLIKRNLNKPDEEQRKQEERQYIQTLQNQQQQQQQQAQQELDWTDYLKMAGDWLGSIF